MTLPFTLVTDRLHHAELSRGWDVE